MTLTLFGESVFADVIKFRVLRGDHPELPALALNPMTSSLLRDTQERGEDECDNDDGDWSDTATSPGMLASARTWNRQRTGSSQKLLEGMQLW